MEEEVGGHGSHSSILCESSIDVAALDHDIGACEQHGKPSGTWHGAAKRAGVRWELCGLTSHEH